jgi:hypothetical protein
MIVIWIGVFIFIQAVVLIFALALGRSAARADREFERARLAEQNILSNSAERNESCKESHISPDTKPSTRFEHSRARS